LFSNQECRTIDVSEDTPCPKTIHPSLALGLRPERLEVGVFSSNFDEKSMWWISNFSDEEVLHHMHKYE